MEIPSDHISTGSSKYERENDSAVEQIFMLYLALNRNNI